MRAVASWRQAEASRGLASLLPFLLIYLVPGLIIVGYLSGHAWTFRIVVWLYLAGLLLDTVLRLEPRAGGAPAGGPLAESTARVALALWVPLHLGLLLCGLLAARDGGAASGGALGSTATLALAVGMTGGMLGVPIAHELMHRPQRGDRALAELLMILMGYPHFCVEHVRGHHRTVGTPADPATARLGESIYSFLPRSVVGGLRSAWRLEGARLARQGRWRLGPRNQVVRGALALAAAHAGIGIVFGPRGNALFALQGLVAVTILEALNYVEHYGLSRRRLADGRYERVMPWHSWDAGRRVSSWLMLNIARHSDHHCEAGRPFHALRDRDEAPQLPAGYFGMFALALTPPLWRRVMDPRARLWQLRCRGLPPPALELDHRSEDLP